MKRVLKNLITSLIVSCSILIGAFSYVKAETLTPIATSSYGSYFAETYFYENQNTYIDNIVIDAGLIQFNINNINSSAFHLHYDFDELYNGTITISITNAINWKLNDCSVAIEGGWFESVPSVSSTAKSKTFVIGVYQSSYIDFIVGHEGYGVTTACFALTTTYSITENIHTTYDEIYYLNNIDDRLLGILSYCDDITNIYDYMTGDMDDTLSNIYTNLQNIYHLLDVDLMDDIGSIDYELSEIMAYYHQLRQFNVPVEMIPAYMLYNPSNLYQSNYSLYPAFIITQTGSETKIFRLNANSEIYFYYITTTAGWHNSISNNNFTLEYERLEQYQISGASIYKITIRNNTNSSATTKYKIEYYTEQDGVITRLSGSITPLYFGNGVGMSDTLRSLLGIEDPVVSLLQQILQDGLVPSTLQNTFNNALQSISDFYSHIIDFLPNVNSFHDDIIDASNNPEYNITNAMGVVNYFYTEFITAFPAVQTFVTLGLAIMVLRVFAK